MMIKRSLIFFALFSACWLCKAQYDISLEVKNSLSDTMYIGYFHLGQTYAFDTCVNAKGKYRFKSKVKSMPAGMYFFSDNTGRYVEFLIDKERKLSFKTDYSDLAANISVKGSEDGKVYYEYIKETNRLGKEFKSLSSRTQNKEEYTEKLNELRLQNEELKEKFVEQHSEHLLSKILMASRPVSFPQVQTKYNQDGSVDSLAMRQENYFNYKQHYFDNVDLTCDALMRTPKEVFANMYSNYWDNVMKYEKADSLIYYTEKLISRTKEGGDMYKYIINDVTKRSLTDNIMGHDKVYVYMVEQYFETGKVTWMHPSDIEMNVQRAKKWKNLLIGKTVPNLACPEDDDKSPWHS
ncbi:MAG: DUF4369 domain-containing protein, partial [Bacteroidales bacterium]|nr:DUF4369 domain-containing protein [Bacteroidales bacterium]